MNYNMDQGRWQPDMYEMTLWKHEEWTKAGSNHSSYISHHDLIEALRLETKAGGNHRNYVSHNDLIQALRHETRQAVTIATLSVIMILWKQ